MITKLVERRQECLTLRSKGFSLSYIVNELAPKYEVTSRAIYKDWKNRKTWIKALLEIKDPETFFLDLLSRHNEIYNQAVLERVKADNSNARIGALNLQRKVNKDFMEMMVISNIIHDLEEIKQKVGVKQT